MSTNFDPTEDEIQVRRQKIYALWKKRRTVPQIVDALIEEYPDISVSLVIEDIKACRTNIKEFAENNPFYLDQRLRLILERVENLDIIADEMWEQYHITDVEHTNVRATYLVNIQKNEMEKAKLLQLLGSAGEIVTKLEQAAKAQQELIQTVRDVTASCPQCANAIALKLKHLSVKKEEKVPEGTRLN